MEGNVKELGKVWGLRLLLRSGRQRASLFLKMAGKAAAPDVAPLRVWETEPRHPQLPPCRPRSDTGQKQERGPFAGRPRHGL